MLLNIYVHFRNEFDYFLRRETLGAYDDMDGNPDIAYPSRKEGSPLLFMTLSLRLYFAKSSAPALCIRDARLVNSHQSQSLLLA